MPPPSEYLGEKAYLDKLYRDALKDKEDYWRRKREELRYQLQYGQEWGGIQPQPRYRPAFYEALGGLPGSRPYLDWFESRFPSLVSEFQATLPTYKGFLTPEAAAREAEEIAGIWGEPTKKEMRAARRRPERKGERPFELSWSEWLKQETPKLKERFWGMRPERRGEKPWAYQPMIRTRSF